MFDKQRVTFYDQRETFDEQWEMFDKQRETFYKPWEIFDDQRETFDEMTWHISMQSMLLPHVNQ
jgi:hypothetical protein